MRQKKGPAAKRGDARPLPAVVVEQDRTLRETVEAGEAAGEGLKQLRWTWTSKSSEAAEARRAIDPDNCERVKQIDYAKAVGVSAPTITRDVFVYEKLRGGNFSAQQAAELHRLPVARRKQVEDRAKATGETVRKANEQIVRQEGRTELPVAARQAVADDAGVSVETVVDHPRLSRQAREVSVGLAEVVEKHPDADLPSVAADLAADLRRQAKPVDTPPAGFGLLLTLLVSHGGQLRGLSEEFSKPWALDTGQIAELEKAWGLFSDDADALKMAIEALRAGGVAAGAEALLRETA